MIGGDITYSCLGNNTFHLTITLYQDCQNGTPSAIAEDDPAFYGIFDAVTGQFIMGNSIPSSSTELVDPNFSNACITNYPLVCMRKQVFITDVTLPPTNNGYKILYQRCCRNQAINNIATPGNVGVTYAATIPPYAANICPNNSPVFKNYPPQIICANNPFVYDFSATDADNDSLSYHLCQAYTGGSDTSAKPTPNAMNPNPQPVHYLGGYSAAVPLPGLPPLQIDPVTGIMTGTPTAVGRYIVTVCVDEYRNGNLINSVSRDVQFVVTNCSKTVVADIPELPDEPNTFTVQCKGYTVKFVNKSTGGFNYLWRFGVNNATSTAFEPTFTYPDTGTYTVTLIVNQGSTCVDSISRLVKIYPQFDANFTWSGKLCPGDPIQFTDQSVATYPPVISWAWSFGDGSSSETQDPVHTYAIPGGAQQVTLIAKTKLGCRDTITQTVPIPYFDPNAGNDTIIVLGYTFKLQGSGCQFYQWVPPTYLSDPNIANPLTNFPARGTYQYILLGSSKEGCTGSDTVNIQVVDDGTIFVPNAFSPNGDGLNDNLEPIIIGISRINYFRIYNRFGQEVYSVATENYPSWNGNFNGKQCDMGTYFYMLDAIDAFGKKVQKKGDITLIR